VCQIFRGVFRRDGICAGHGEAWPKRGTLLPVCAMAVQVGGRRAARLRAVLRILGVHLRRVASARYHGTCIPGANDVIWYSAMECIVICSADVSRVVRGQAEGIPIRSRLPDATSRHSWCHAACLSGNTGCISDIVPGPTVSPRSGPSSPAPADWMFAWLR
jgi:hypothetical protein